MIRMEFICMFVKFLNNQLITQKSTNMNLKTTTFLCFTVLLLSCNGKKESIESKSEFLKESDCNCAELQLLQTNENGEQVEVWKNVKKDGELYTGNCTEKDQNDTIIRKLEIKNGWVVREVKKENVIDKIYIITNDMEYNQLQKSKGFTIGLSMLLPGEKRRYISNYEDYKNGNRFDKWAVGATNDFGTNRIAVSRYYDKGKPLNWAAEQDTLGGHSSAGKIKCLENPELMKGSDNEMEWVKNDMSDSDFVKSLKCLKSELPPFDYWEVK